MNERQSWPTDPRTPHLRWDLDRHGTPRCYYRNRDVAGSAQVRLRAPFGTEAFLAEYQQAEASVLAGTVTKVARVEKRQPRGEAVQPRDGNPRSLNFLLTRYYASTDWLDGLGEETRRDRRYMLDRACLHEAELEGSTKVEVGEFPYARIDKGFVMDLRDVFKAAPSMANLLVQSLKKAFDYALDRKMPQLTCNPCLGIKRLNRPNASHGFHQWTIDDVEAFEKQYPIGTRARAAMAVLLYTGVRRSDAVRLTDDMVLDGIDGEGKRCKVLSFTPVKGTERKRREGKTPIVVTIPILPDLQRVLDATPRPKGCKHWILSLRDQPFTNAHAFTDRVSEWCTDIGLPMCTPHGLRKAGAAFCAEAGMSHADLMAIFGWETMSQPDLYIRRFQRARAAMRAMPKFTIPRRSPTQAANQSHRQKS